jgi:hypothetical protein
MDLKTSFFQILLPDHTRNAFVLRDSEGRIFRFCRLPMGYKLAVDIMHNVLLGIVAELTRRVPELANGVSDSYVDNFLVAHPDLSVLRRAQSVLAEIATTAAITIGDMLISTSTEHRGVLFREVLEEDDVSRIPRSTIRFMLKLSFQDKIAKHLSTVLTTTRKIASSQYDTIVGEVTYADAILMATPVRQFLHLYSQWTAHGRSRATISEAARHELQRALQWIHCSFPLDLWYTPSHHASPHPPQLTQLHFTDASKDFLGFVNLQSDGFSQRWSSSQVDNPLDISQASSASELLAMVTEVNHTMFHPEHLHVFAGDNTAAVRAMARRYSSSPALHSILRQLQAFPRHATFYWLPGLINPADLPSRVRGPPPFPQSLNMLGIAETLYSSGAFGRRRLGVGGPVPVSAITCRVHHG